MAGESKESDAQSLLKLLAEKEKEIDKLKQDIELLTKVENGAPSRADISPGDDLTKEEVMRYGRQLILPLVGVEGQKRLRNGSVLIIGAGGLGCPAAIYLAGAGIGRLGIVDYDAVDESNLHRQILHHESAVGSSKAASVAQAVRSLNSLVKVEVHDTQLDKSNASELVSDYDVVLDCSDNPATRYLINDTCVLTKKPLVSGSALRLEGQLTVYNHRGGPCYRCLFPTPPDAKFVTNCSDGGVLGPVPGLIGTLQAMETIKLVVGECPSYSRRLLIFDGHSGAFRVVSLRPKQSGCSVCGDAPTITDLQRVDYVAFCGRGATDKEEGLKVLDRSDRVSAGEFAQQLRRTDSSSSHVLIDVRPRLETAICRLPSPSINIPFDELDGERLANLCQSIRQQSQDFETVANRPFPVYVICRRGNNSQLAVNKLKTHLKDCCVAVKDIVSGLDGWVQEVDPNFPIY